MKQITYVGRLIYAKGVQDLLKAFAVLTATHNDIQLLIIGEGNYKSDLYLKTTELRLHDKVFFLGEKSSREIVKILKRTAVFVNPSYSEGMPTSVMEAAACGCSIVATDVGGTDEIIINGATGLLVQPGSDCLYSAIDYMLKNEQRAKEMGKAAQRHVKQMFNWDKIVNQYETVLNSVLLNVLNASIW